MVVKWLITGGCGFLGTSLIKRLVSEGGHAIRILDNLSVGTREDLSEVIVFNEIDISKEFIEPEVNTGQLIIGDIRDQAIAENAARGMDVIVHFAANTGVPVSVAEPRTDMECNVIGTFNMLEAARLHGVGRFVFASSGAPAGEVEPPIHEELPAHPVSPYGASKLAGEGYCSSYFKTFAVDTVSLRFGNVYGPGSKHKSSVVAKFIRKAINGETLEIYGDGSQTRDFIYIDDLIDAVVNAANIPAIGGEVFQIASNKETTVSEMVGMLLPILKNEGVQIPEIINSEKRLGDVSRNYSDTSKANRILKWKPKVYLSEGLKKTVSSLCGDYN